MADKTPATDTAAVKDELNAAAAKRGRPATRVEGGKSISTYFTPDELDGISEARFVGKHDKVSDLIKAAVNQYVTDTLTTVA